MSRMSVLQDSLHGKCQLNPLITHNRKERLVIIIQEVQVDRQVPKGGAVKRAPTISAN
jgi:hypothetical protein